ncbi:hypothetical protein MRX96_034162 [Rhipicephalus microplus]
MHHVERLLPEELYDDGVRSNVVEELLGEVCPCVEALKEVGEFDEVVLLEHVLVDGVVASRQLVALDWMVPYDERDEVPDQASDQVPEQVPDQVLDPVIEQVFEQVFEQVLDQAFDQVPDQVHDQVLDQMVLDYMVLDEVVVLN